MHNEAKYWIAALLRILERRNHGDNIFRCIFVVIPKGKETVAEVFVHCALVFLDYLLADREPGTNERGQFVAQQFVAKRREILYVCDQEPTRNILNSLL